MIDKNDPRLTAYLLDELDPQELATIEKELAESSELREQLEGLKITIGVLNRAYENVGSSDDTMTAAQLHQIDTAAKSNNTAVGPWSDIDSAHPVRWRNFAIAALLLYALGISAFAFRKPVTITSLSSEKAKVAEATRSSSTPAISSDDRGGGEDHAASVPHAENGLTVTLDEPAYPVADNLTVPVDLFDTPDAATLDGKGRQSQIDRGMGTGMNMDAGMGMGTDMEMDMDMGGEMNMDSGTGMGMATDMEMGMGGEMMEMDGEMMDMEMESMEMGGMMGGGMGSSGGGGRVDANERFLRRAKEEFEREMSVPSARPSESVTEREMIRLRGVEEDIDIVSDLTSELAARVVDATGSASVAGENDRGEGEEAAEDESNVELDKMAAFKPRKRSKQTKTWKPASAATNRARLSVGHHDDLALAARDTYVRIDGFRARVFFDCYYYNDRPQQLEGQFMLRLPNDASLHYFAFGPTTLPTPDPPPPTGKPGEAAQAQSAAAVQSLWEQTRVTGSDLARRANDSDYSADPNSLFGLVKSARVVPRQKAALAYDETVRRRVDPALVEWAGPGIFQTRVFPLVPNQLHRIIVGYDVMLQDDGDDRVYTLQLPEEEAAGRVEFDVAAAVGTAVTISPETDAFVSGDRAYYRFLDAQPRDYTVRLSGSESVVLNTSIAPGDEYFATRLIANLPDQPADTSSPQAVFLLDTSWSDRPAAFSRRLKLLEQVLRQNRDTIKQFNVLLFNVEQRWWRSEFVANDVANVAALMRDADELALEGATDLYHALAAATHPTWMPERDESLPQPNYFLLSDASATWGKTDLASLADPLRQLDRSAGGGALFAYHLAGHPGDNATQQWLAEASGGAVFDVAEQAGLSGVATAHRSRPWQIVNVTARGADEILVQGASTSVYPNQPLVIAGRGQMKGPLRIMLERGTEKETLEFEPEVAIASPAAARLYGQLAVERLEPYGENLDEVTTAFARYFRVPGRTCSMVMLETAEDYQRFGVNVPAREDQLVIASTSIAEAIEEQELEMLEQRVNPRKRFLAWVDSLQSASLLNVSTALKLAIKRTPDTAFRFDAKPLRCRSWKNDQLGEGFLQELRLDAPGFEAVMDEAERKLAAFGADDALKTASTLVEAKPSDVDTLRSVAFRAIQWQRSDQAAPLLWRLAQARPYQPQCLLLLARAMSESGDADSAIICFDLVSSGNWNERWSGAKAIAEVELLHVLEQVDSGALQCAFPQYARARLQQLRSKWCQEGLDLAVVMHWNTDRTDVDLHVTEPSGEECFYSHNRTRSGGRLTQDITEGLGPEMYSLENAPAGQYKVEAKYYSGDANRTKAPTETLLTILRNVGRDNVQSQTKHITLNGTGQKQVVMQLKVKH